MNNKEQKTCVIYCRVSSKDQVEGTSLGSQERLSKEYAERQNIKVLKVFIERGESAKTAERTEFNKALAFCSDKKNRVGYFIVYKIDRFARNQDDHGIVRAVLKKHGVVLRSVTEQIDETSSGRLLEGMLSAFAEFDNNVRTERTKGGMLERVKQGIWVWPEPLGYYRPAKGANIVPDPERAPLIKLCFEEYAKGIYTYRELANYLGDRGLKTKLGKRPCPQLIQKIIVNPIYFGSINIKNWETQTGSFEAIVSQSLFNKCQVGYKESTHIAPRSANNPLFPLRGALCNVCNSTITGSCSRGKRGKTVYPYYHHIHYKNCAKARWVPKETFEQLFIEYLNDITPSGKYEKLFKAVVVEIWKGNYKRLDTDNARVRAEIEVLERDRQKVFELHLSGKYTDEEFMEQKQIINSSINKKHLLMQDNRVEEFDMEEALSYCFDFVRTTAKTWQEFDYAGKLRFQKLVCKDKINFNGEEFGNSKLSQVYQLNREYNGSKSHLVALRGIEPRFSG